MSDKELMDLNGGVGLTAGEVSDALGLYVVDADGNSRFVSFANLKAAINTSPTVLPASQPWRGARVGRNTDLTGLTFPYVISWNNEFEDTNNFWSSGAPTRFTVPSGVSRVRLSGSLTFESVAEAGTLFVNFLKNGNSMTGCTAWSPRQNPVGFINNNALGFTWADPCVPGDYYEFRVNKSGLASVDQILSSFNTWFQIEVVESIL